MDALGIMQLQPPNMPPMPTRMRHTHAQLTTADLYVPITDDITLQVLAGLTLIADSSAKRRCPDN